MRKYAVSKAEYVGGSRILLVEVRTVRYLPLFFFGQAFGATNATRNSCPDNQEMWKTRALDGYPSLADFLASDRDRTILAFKRFDRLAVRNLLYLQSELAELQSRQDAYDAQDISIEDGDLAAKQCARNWGAFTDAVKKGDEKQKDRMELVIEIRKKMKEYSKRTFF